MTPDDPRHGTNAGYAYGGCRQDCCRRAHSRQMNLWRMGRSDKLVDATTALRRIDALMCLGYSRSTISVMMGRHRDYLAKTRKRTRLVGRVWTQIAELYDELCMTPAPDSPVARRTRAYALRNGHVPPLGWIDIDDLDESPTDWSYVAADRATAVRELAAAGENATHIARRLDLTPRALERWCQRHLPDVWRTLAQREGDWNSTGNLGHQSRRGAA